MEVQPYLFFDGCCEEALEFYKSALGAGVTMLMRCSESSEEQLSGRVAVRFGVGWMIGVAP
jgi:PhnB protein